MNGTRVIYYEGSKDKTIKLTNTGEYPSLVQVWMDVNNDESTPVSADAPFIITPHVFKLNAGRSQIVRLKFVGEDLPSERESLFHINFSQMPATTSGSQQNKLTLLFNNRLKLFYRPVEIASSSIDYKEMLDISIHNGRVKAQNITPFHSVISSVTIDGEEIASGEVLAPYSYKIWEEVHIKAFSSKKIKVAFVNDFGAITETEYFIDGNAK
ncbi:TPA: fimbrial biogenesis chaperone [Aeromonas veronii]